MLFERKDITLYSNSKTYYIYSIKIIVNSYEYNFQIFNAMFSKSLQEIKALIPEGYVIYLL